MKKEKILIILDSFEYKNREKEFCEWLSSENVDPVFFYSKYENWITEIFQETKIIGSLLTHLSYWILSFIYALRLLSPKYKHFKTLIFVNPIVGIFFGGLKRLFGIKQNITIGGFLFEDKSNMIYYNARHAFVNFCYKFVNKIFVYGENEIKHYESIFPNLKGKFQYVKYGRDFTYKKIKDFSYEGKYIASGGRSNRKFSTLSEAMGILKAKNFVYNCLIATRPECVTKDMEKYPVTFEYGITLNQFGSFIRHSSIFVLPLLNTKLSAGHMAMMEAMANCKPIIVTDIPAIRDYVSNEEVTFYTPDNSVDLADKIEYVINNLHSSVITDKVIKGKTLYEEEYSFKALLKRLVKASL